MLILFSDLISLPEREFGDSFNKSLSKSSVVLKKKYDWIILEFEVFIHKND